MVCGRRGQGSQPTQANVKYRAGKGYEAAGVDEGDTRVIGVLQAARDRNILFGGTHLVLALVV